jgi:hypothetical protein
VSIGLWIRISSTISVSIGSYTYSLFFIKGYKVAFSVTVSLLSNAG